MSITIESYKNGKTYVECRYDKYNGFELLVCERTNENDIYTTTYRNTYANEKSVKRAFKRFIKKIKKNT